MFHRRRWVSETLGLRQGVKSEGCLVSVALQLLDCLLLLRVKSKYNIIDATLLLLW